MIRRMIPQAFIQDLLGRVDIVDVVDRYVQLKKGGRQLPGAAARSTTRRRPRSRVSPTKQFYHCFGCGAHGNAIGFLMEYCGHGLPRGDQGPRRDGRHAGARDAPRAPSKPARRREAPSLAARDGRRRCTYYRAELKKSQRAIDYLKGRGLSGEIAARFGLGYAPDGWQNLEAVFADYDDEAAEGHAAW